MIIPKVTIDASGLNRGLALASDFTKREPADSCNFAGLAVAVETRKQTPFVTPDKMDAELFVIGNPVIGKRGKPLKNKKTYSSAKGSGDNGVPFAVLIIQSQATPGSVYNERTNNRYAGPSPFKGVSREAGRAAMRAAEDKMIKRRHRSSRFLGAGWLEAIRILMAYVKSYYGRSSLAGVGTQGEDLGTAIPAQKGSPVASCTIENLIGYEGQNKESFNRALQEYGAPALQNALDGEGRKQMQYYLDRVGGKLASDFNKAAS